MLDCCCCLPFESAWGEGYMFTCSGHLCCIEQAVTVVESNVGGRSDYYNSFNRSAISFYSVRKFPCDICPPWHCSVLCNNTLLLDPMHPWWVTYICNSPHPSTGNKRDSGSPQKIIPTKLKGLGSQFGYVFRVRAFLLWEICFLGLRQCIDVL